MSLKNDVQVHRRFQRSIRLDTDLDDPLALQGFICPPTFAHALTTLSQQIKDAGHAAFTWTGPFGGGKSSLAVVFPRVCPDSIDSVATHVSVAASPLERKATRCRPRSQ